MSFVSHWPRRGRPRFASTVNPPDIRRCWPEARAARIRLRRNTEPRSAPRNSNASVSTLGGSTARTLDGRRWRRMAERRPKSRAFGEASGRWIARTAAAAALPTYRVGPVPVLVALGAADGDAGEPVAPKLHVGPSERGSFGAPKQGVPHDRHERDIHLTAEAGRAGPLGSAAPSRAPLMGSRTDRGQPLLREGGGLSRGVTLARRPAGESAQHPAHPFVIGRVRVSGVGVMVANGGAVQADDAGDRPLAARSARYAATVSGNAEMGQTPSRSAHIWNRRQAAR